MDRVTQADLPAVRAFLNGRIERAMFPLSNLADYGLDGDHAYAPRMWARFDGDAVTAVLTVSTNGTVIPLCAPQLARPILRGREVSAVLGPAELCRPLIAALPLTDTPKVLDRDEPQFTLDLSALRVPDGPGRLAPLEAAEANQMIAWRAAYEAETLGAAPDRALAAGQRSYAAYVARGSHRVLLDGETPLATTGFNARLPEIVQIGGVYTPPERRSQGHARRAVALHLAEARGRGVTRATLFASGPPAVRAYDAIGFARIGTWTICLLKEPADV